MVQSNTILFLKFLIVDVVGSVLYFPVWWYSKGVLRAASYCGRTVRSAARDFGVAVWLKNLFKPMYGQRDFTGRVISFFLRLLAIFWYSLMLLLISAVMLLVFLAWLAFPIFVAGQFFTQLSGLINAAPK